MNTKNELNQKVERIIRNWGERVIENKTDFSLQELDEFDYLGVLIGFEEEFDIIIEKKDEKHLTTIDQISEYIILLKL